MKLFDLDSPIMQGLSKMADLLLLNVLALVCCIPIVTIGASLTALDYMSLKLVRNEECYIVKGFFKSFKENLKEATILWLILLVVIAVLIGDYMILQNMTGIFSEVLRVVITVVAVILAFTATFLFPTLSKFDNPVFRTFKNAFAISILQLPKTILMIIINVIPWLILIFSIRLFPLVFFFGLSGPSFLGALLYNKFFKKLEAQIEEAGEGGEQAPDGEDDERIFHDEVDESISVDENRR